MIARYFPDRWSDAIDDRRLSVSLVESFVETYVNKLPALALSLILESDITFSTLPPPWWS
jgi:hypothetical protein